MVGAVVAAQVGAERRLPVRRRLRHQEAAGAAQHLRAKEPPDGQAPSEPGRQRRHLEHRVVGEQPHERIEVGVLERRRVPVHDQAPVMVGGLADVVLADPRLPQRAPGALQGAVHRHGRDLEQLGGLRRVPAEHVAQDEHGPLPGGQVLQGGDQREPRALPGHHDRGRIARAAQAATRQERVGNRLQPRHVGQRVAERRIRVRPGRAQPSRQRPPAAVLDRPQAGVGGDAVQPGPQRRAALEPVPRPPGAQQGLLQHVLGVVHRPEHPVAVREQFRPERVCQAGEFLAVPRHAARRRC
jgi:hypothetical protein